MRSATPPRSRWKTGLAIAFGAIGVGVLGTFLAVRAFVPSDEELAAQLAQGFEKASGVPLSVGGVSWSIFPVPTVMAHDLKTGQAEPIVVRRIVLHPRLGALWQRQVAIDRAEIEGAVLPRASVREFRGRFGQDPKAEAASLLGERFTLAPTPLARLDLRDITWIDRRGIALAYDARVDFDPAWRPRSLEAWRPGITPAARLRATREGDADRWKVLIDVGGGTWNGDAELRSTDAGRLRATASLVPKDVDVATLTRSFGRHHSIEGRIQGQTEVEAEADQPGELLRHLKTRTRFRIQPATVVGFDLAKAVRTAGTDRSGQTVLDQLSGVVQTETREDGMLIRYIDLKASSGLLTASGNVSVFNRRLDGEVAIDIVDGLVGVPFKLAGTLEQPRFTLTGAAATGAAIGTAVLPGVGTAIGARIGQKFERLFGADEKPAKSRPRPSGSPSAR